MMSRGSNITYSSTIWPFFHLAIVVKNVSARFPVGAIVPPSTARLEAVDRKQPGRPILETGRVEGPAACVREPLSLRKVELRLFPFFDIEANPDPIKQASIARQEWFGATEKPTIRSFSATNSEGY